MGSRRRAREAALQALYQLDLNPGLTPEQALAHVFETFGRGEHERLRPERSERHRGRAQAAPNERIERESEQLEHAEPDGRDRERGALASDQAGKLDPGQVESGEREGQLARVPASEGGPGPALAGPTREGQPREHGEHEAPVLEVESHEKSVSGPIAETEQRSFATKLVQGVMRSRAEIDQILARASTHWRLDRMAAVDRNLLRLAVHELLHEAAIPASVTIDEAVEIAKRYGTAESPAFVNGVLHRVAAEAKVPK